MALVKIQPFARLTYPVTSKWRFSLDPGLFVILKTCIFLMIVAIPGEILFAEKLPKRAGWIEEIMISPGSLRLWAKLDTGAKSSSLHAENILSFSRDGETWVKFDVFDKEGAPVTFERKVLRTVKIKRHKQKSAERPVVLMGVCLGNHFAETEVNLSDRSNYKYPVLIGRMFLEGHFMVDASSQHLLDTSCPMVRGTE